MYLFSIKKQTADSIKMTLGHLDNEILHRQKISTIYFDKLKHVSEITLFSPIGNVVSWRFSFCVNTDIRQDLLDTIRSQGFDASSWYPCIANWYDPKGMAENKYPVANQIEKQIVNIWVSQNYSIERADNLADTIVEFFQ